MAPTMPQAGQDFQINSRLVPPNPSEAHTHHSNRGQTASLVICQRPQSICSSLSSVVAGGGFKSSGPTIDVLSKNFLPQSSTSSWKAFFRISDLILQGLLPLRPWAPVHVVLFLRHVTWALDYFAYIHIRTL